MTQEIQNEIDKLKKQLNNQSVPDSLKATMRAKLAKLEESVQKTEAQVEVIEKKEEQLEKKAEVDLTEAIQRMEKQLKNPNIPDSLKSSIREKLEKAKKDVKETKQEQVEEKKIKEEKVKEVKEEVKETFKKVKEAIAKAPKTPKETKEKEVQVKKAVSESTEVIKKAKKVKEEASKKSVEGTKKRTSKLKGALRELQAIINANPTLKALYKGKGVDLKRDAARQAKPVGYRFKGKHNYRIPKNLDNPNVYYEGRPDKGDAYQNKRRGVYFADGGMMADGGVIAKIEDKFGEVVFILKKGVLYENTTEIASGFKSKQEAISYLKKVSNEEGYGDKMQYFANGGMMARGGMTLKVDDYVYDENGEQLLVTKVTPNDYFLYEFGDAKAYGYSKKEVHDNLSSGKWSRTQGLPEYKVTGYERIYFDGHEFSINYEENGVEKSGKIKSDSKSNAIKQFKQKHPKAKVTGVFERVKIKEDGGMMARGGMTKEREILEEAYKQKLITKKEYEDEISKLMMPRSGAYGKKGMSSSIREYYMNAFPTDDMGADINPNATFKGLLQTLDSGKETYNYIGVYDSLVRERIFEKLSELTGLDYAVIYDKWLSTAGQPLKRVAIKAPEYINKNYKKADDGMMVFPEYKVVGWMSEEDRDMGESESLGMYDSLEEAKRKADVAFYRQGYAAIEVLNGDDEVVYFLEEGSEEFAKGGKTSRYNKGLSWHQDHARHNNSQKYEVPVNRRKR